MYDAAAFTTSLSGLASPPLRDPQPAAALDGLLTRLVELLGLRGAAVALQADGRLSTVVATSTPLLELERVREQAGAGPLAEAVRSRRPVTVPDVRVETARWPAYAAAARAHDWSGVLAGPLCWDGRVLGGAAVFSREPHRWTGRDLRAGQLLGEMVTGHLVQARLLLQQQRLSEQLQTALDSRVIIEQAKGVVAHARSIAPDEAFEIIRQSARRRRLGLHDVARGIVHHGQEP